MYNNTSELLYLKLEVNKLFYKLLKYQEEKSNKLIFEIIYYSIGNNAERYERYIDRNKGGDFMIYEVINLITDTNSLEIIINFFKNYIILLSDKYKNLL